MADPDVHISVTPLYNAQPGDEDFESDMFEFDVEAAFIQAPDGENDDIDRLSDVLDFSDDQVPVKLRQETFMVERRADDESFREYVKFRLVCLGVPDDVMPQLIDRILHEAKSSERDKGFLGCKVIRMRFSIDVFMNDDDEDLNLDSDEDEDEDDYDDDDDIDAVMVPASKSSMESLERMNVEGSSNMQCSICLEEISSKIEAIRLPCSHVYHDQCILCWLEKNGKCPLCRFEI